MCSTADVEVHIDSAVFVKYKVADSVGSLNGEGYIERERKLC